jgi:hypothetical protein
VSLFFFAAKVEARKQPWLQALGFWKSPHNKYMLYETTSSFSEKI